MTTYNLTFDPSGWLEITYYQVVKEETTVVQSTSYHPTQLELINADCEKNSVKIEDTDAEAIAKWVADYSV